VNREAYVAEALKNCGMAVVKFERKKKQIEVEYTPSRFGGGANILLPGPDSVRWPLGQESINIIVCDTWSAR